VVHLDLYEMGIPHLDTDIFGGELRSGMTFEQLALAEQTKTASLCILRKGVSRNHPYSHQDMYVMRSWFILIKKAEVDPPLAAAKIQRITQHNYRFLQTMFGVEAEAGKQLMNELMLRKKP